jgi:2-methylcitrate dehydratase PrpD
MKSLHDSPIAVTAELAQFVATLEWDTVPPHVQALMPVLMIDVFRAAAVGRDKPWTRSVKHVFGNTTGDACATLFYSDQQVEIGRAALINGTACGSLDWDDSHVAAIIHPGVCIWPAALAAAETVGATGRELLTAVLAGYEVAIRIGMSIQPEHSLRGFQGTPTCGAFGAAAACARLFKLSAESTRDALGIAATFACGLSQFFVSGSDIKRFHAGKAAANGVEAALLARAGLTGPHDAIEGSQGFARAFSDRFDASTVVKDLGVHFPTEWISLKPHAGSVRMQAAIEAAAMLAREGVRMDQVATMEIGVHGAMVGKLTANKPVDYQQAQLSTPFAAAMAVALAPQRDGPLSLSVDDFALYLNDADIRDLSARTTCIVDEKVERLTTAESVPARVTCVMRDGRRFEQFVEHPKGCPQNPITAGEVEQRFAAITGSQFGADAVQAWLSCARQPVRLDSVAPLFSLRG